MDPNDERWNQFLEAHQAVVDKYDKLLAFTEHIMSKCSKWLPEVPEEWYDELDEITGAMRVDEN